LLKRELLLALWGKDRSDLSSGIRLMNAMNLQLSSTQYGSTAVQRGGDFNQTSIDVDAFLHPIVNAYRFEEAIDLFRDNGLDWAAVNGINLPGSSQLLDLAEVATDEELPFCVQAEDLLQAPELVERYRRLERRAQLQVIELTLKCTGFTILAGRGDSYRTLGPRVQGNVLRLDAGT
jgi:hypothetical protein